jgi:hypothetical protein
VTRGWVLVESAARLLEPDERESVLGDLMEAGESAWRGLLGIIGLVIRRQMDLWRGWRPWLAGFGVALPNSSLLMGVSLSVSWSYMRLLCPELLAQASLSKPSAFFVLLWQAVLLIGWSWTGGFVVGSVSRRTLWASTLLCYSPCLFCLTRFRVGSLPRFSILLFLLPAFWGAHRGLQISRMKLSSALLVAMGITVMMIPGWNNGAWYWWSPRRWVLNWVLSLPAWYLVFTACRATSELGERRVGDNDQRSDIQSWQ